MNLFALERMKLWSHFSSERWQERMRRRLYKWWVTFGSRWLSEGAVAPCTTLGHTGSFLLRSPLHHLQKDGHKGANIDKTIHRARTWFKVNLGKPPNLNTRVLQYFSPTKINSMTFWALFGKILPNLPKFSMQSVRKFERGPRSSCVRLGIIFGILFYFLLSLKKVPKGWLCKWKR